MALGPANRREFLVGAGGLFLSAAAQRAGPWRAATGGEAPGGRMPDTALAAAIPSASASPDAETPPRGLRRRGEQLIVSTWNMGVRANNVAWEVLRDAGTAHPLEACETFTETPHTSSPASSMAATAAPTSRSSMFSKHGSPIAAVSPLIAALIASLTLVLELLTTVSR